MMHIFDVVSFLSFTDTVGSFSEAGTSRNVRLFIDMLLYAGEYLCFDFRLVM